MYIGIGSKEEKSHLGKFSKAGYMPRPVNSIGLTRHTDFKFTAPRYNVSSVKIHSVALIKYSVS